MNLKSTINKTLLEELLEDPPNRLHEREIHCLIRLVHIDPSSHPLHNLFPLF